MFQKFITVSLGRDSQTSGVTHPSYLSQAQPSICTRLRYEGCVNFRNLVVIPELSVVRRLTGEVVQLIQSLRTEWNNVRNELNLDLLRLNNKATTC